MTTRKLSTTDAFVVVDLPDAPVAAGVVRLAPKVLIDGATWLARSQTYQFAVFGRRASGASAGINAAADARGDALAAFEAEIAPDASSLLLEGGRGVGASDLAALRDADPRPAEWWDQRAGLRAAGIAAAARVACGGSLEGRTVALEATDDAAEVADALTALGATLAGGAPAPAAEVLGAAADVLVVGSKAGVLDHEAVPGVQAKVVVPSGPIPATAKALAALGRAGVVVLPDFVTTAGHLVAWPDGGEALPADLPAAAAELVGAAVSGLLDHPAGPVLGACEQAEAFLSTWAEIPFGRPIA